MSDFEKQLLTSAILGILDLINDGDLVRNTKDYGSIFKFMNQSQRIIKAMKSVHDAMEHACPGIMEKHYVQTWINAAES